MSSRRSSWEKRASRSWTIRVVWAAVRPAAPASSSASRWHVFLASPASLNLTGGDAALKRDDPPGLGRPGGSVA